jgi:hypothetical protein
MQKNVWLKSSLSSGGDNCVEVRQDDNGVVSVRDSKLGEASPVLSFAPTEWVAFTRGTQRGEFDWG